ncbi:hypothetical protein ABMD59_005469, partial [Escherichia coli]
MNINDTEYHITHLALVGLKQDLLILGEDAMHEGNRTLGITLKATLRLIDAAMNIMDQQRRHITAL